MKFLLLIPFLFLVGCMSSEHIPVLDKDGNTKTNMFGITVKEKKKTTNTKAVADAFVQAIEKVSEKELPKEPEKTSNGCLQFTTEQVMDFDATKFAAAVSYMQNCNMMQFQTQMLQEVRMIVRNATGQPVSDIDALARQMGKTVGITATAIPNTLKSVAPVVVTGAVSHKGLDVIDSGFKAMSEMGNTQIGSISVNSGDDIAEGGAASGPVNLTIGSRNNTQVTTDNGRSIQGPNQELASSATGNLNNDGKQNGPVTSDEFTGDPTIEDNDGFVQ